MTDESDRRITRRDLLRAGAIGTAAALAGCSGGDSGSDGDSGGGGDGDPGSDGDGETDDESAPDSGDDSGTGDGTDAGDGGEPEPDADGSPDDQQPDRDEPERDIPHASEYGTVVDVVADGGADPNGEETIAPVLDAHAGDDTLLFFPSGEYLLDDVWQLPSFEHLGVVGDDATIVPREGYDGYLFVFGFPDRAAADLLFEGIDFDFTASNTAPRPLQAQIDDGIDVRSVTVRGRSGTARFDVTTEDGSGTVRNLVLADGGREPNPVGVLVGPANRGELRFENCHVEGFPGNGLYASPSNGPIEVVGGEYANNGIASIRVSSPATVRDVHVRCDEAPDGFRNMRGIRLRHGENALVENCTVEMTDVTYSDGAVVVEPMMESATIRDVDIELSVDEVPAINARTPEIERASTSGNDGTASDDADPAADSATDTVTTDIECRRVSVTGDAAGGAAVKLVDRDGCQLRDVDISQSGAGRDGVHLIRSSESILRNSEIEVTGESLVLEQSEVERINTRL